MSFKYCILTNPINFKAASHTTDAAWLTQDTIHYLSPATTARTVCEGDFDYGVFSPYYGKMSIPPYSTESSISCEEPRLQRTVAIIKPEAMMYKDVVLKAIVDKGFSIVNVSIIYLNEFDRSSNKRCGAYHHVFVFIK